MTAPTYVLVGTSLVIRVFVSLRSRDTHDSVDATPLVVCLSLALAGIIHMGDPLNEYGLSISLLFKCPWKALFLLWFFAFLIGRVASALFLRSCVGLSEALAEGFINPGGVYLSLRGFGKLSGMTLALPMVCSQTFMEEFIFRGLLVRLGNRLCCLFGMSPRLAGFMSITGSGILFGLIHFIPAFYCLEGRSIAIPLYALIMPTTLGIVFAVLNQASCSIWPGWIVHFGLNYAGFVWDRLSGKWERRGLK